MLSQEANWLLKEKYSDQESPEFLTDLKRLQDGEPLAYLIGHIPFLNTEVCLDTRPLIPRPETEFWVEKAIAEIKSAAEAVERPIKVLDLCAGSGCIGVAVLKAVPNTEVDFVELETKHHLTITKNLQHNNIKTDRTNILGGDLFTEVNGTYDFILTNPPYIDPALDRTSISVKEFEPAVALYGGEAGIAIIKKILESVSDYLEPTGVLYLEHEPEQSQIIRTICLQHGMGATVFMDQFNVERYTRVVSENS